LTAPPNPPDGAPASDHYFSPAPAAASAPRDIRVVVDGHAMHLTTDRGVFSGDHLDPGTAVLLSRAPAPPATGTLLDIGCGYGVIACSLARRAPGATVVAVDVNARALELTRANAQRLGLSNVVVEHPDGVGPDLTFAAIYSNPPIHVGKPLLHALLLRWLPRLEPDGRAYLVVHRHLGSDSLQRWLDSIGFPCERMASVRGYRVLAARHAADG
jgi:16S rRNA (guanine1207-N2)-methyltransferase